MTRFALEDHLPVHDDTVFIAPDAAIVGSVTLGGDSSVWFGAVLRGDNEPIAIGARTSIQDAAVVHTDPGYPVEVGDGVTVGHRVVLHGCRIGDGSLVGIGSVILNGARIGRQCLVGACALVTESKDFPDRTLILGTPARAVRELRDEELEHLRRAADAYVDKTRRYLAALRRL